jgi:hypothetical protein
VHIAIDICAMLWTVLKCAVVCYREATVVQSETNAELRQRQQALADMKQLHAVGPPPAHPAAPVRCYSIAARGLLQCRSAAAMAMARFHAATHGLRARARACGLFARAHSALGTRAWLWTRALFLGRRQAAQPQQVRIRRARGAFAAHARARARFASSVLPAGRTSVRRCACMDGRHACARARVCVCVCVLEGECSGRGGCLGGSFFF